MRIFSRTRTQVPSVEQRPHPEWGLITYKRISRGRRLKLTVQPFQGVVVTLPSYLGFKEAEQLLVQKRTWIQKTLAHCRTVEARAAAFYASVDPMARPAVRRTLQQRLDELAGKHGFAYGKLSIRDQQTRWGSCSAKDNISLNQKLIFLPEILMDYVLLHELAHTREKNHSLRFWNILYAILGETTTRAAKRQLRDFEFLFYPPRKP